MTGPVSISIDDLDSPPPTPAASLSEIKIDGDSVPESLRGKTAEDLVKMAQGLENALRTSESARQQQEMLLRMAAEKQPEVPQPREPEEQELSDEQLADLYSQNPIQAIKYMTDKAQKTATRNLEQRLGPMFGSNAAQVERQMREKYKVEFELFGQDITRLLDSVPNKNEMLANPAAWEDAISLVRGREGNIQRYVQKLNNNTPEQRREAARAEQVEQVGFTDSAIRPRRLDSAVQMDDTMREIARNMGLSESEYVKWYNQG